MPAKGIKKQVLGGVLFCLGMMTALLARMLGFELDIFYVVISIFGAALFLYGAIQKSRHKLAVGAQHADKLCTESAVITETQPHGTEFHGTHQLDRPAGLDGAKSFNTRRLAISGRQESR